MTADMDDLDAYVAHVNELLQDEIARLTEQLHYANGTCDLAMKHRDEAEADNERLRAALREIAAYPHSAEGGEIARAALKEPKP